MCNIEAENTGKNIENVSADPEIVNAGLMDHTGAVDENGADENDAEENDADKNNADVNYEAVIEGILFTMGEPVERSVLAMAMDIPEVAVEAAVAALQKTYEAENRGLQIIRLEDSYQMCTKEVCYEPLIRIAARPKKPVLTDVVMETLAIIAYKQPITKMEIEKIRGVSSDHAVNKLVEYGLVCEAGRLNAPGRPMLFATTEEFLRRFQVESLEELPLPDPDKLAEIQEAVAEETGYYDDTVQTEKKRTDDIASEDIVSQDESIDVDELVNIDV